MNINSILIVGFILLSIARPSVADVLPQSPMDVRTVAVVNDVLVHDDGSYLLVGQFDRLGETEVTNIAKFDANHEQLPISVIGLNGTILRVIFAPSGATILVGEFYRDGSKYHVAVADSIGNELQVRENHYLDATGSREYVANAFAVNDGIVIFIGGVESRIVRGIENAGEWTFSEVIRHSYPFFVEQVSDTDLVIADNDSSYGRRLDLHRIRLTASGHETVWFTQHEPSRPDCVLFPYAMSAGSGKGLIAVESGCDYGPTSHSHTDIFEFDLDTGTIEATREVARTSRSDFMLFALDGSHWIIVGSDPANGNNRPATVRYSSLADIGILDTSTGDTQWCGQFSGGDVKTVAAIGDEILIAGEFWGVDGEATSSVFRMSNHCEFVANPLLSRPGTIYDLDQTSDGGAFLVGDFTQINGMTLRGSAYLSPSLQLFPHVQADAPITKIIQSGSDCFVIGNFGALSGVDAKYAAKIVDCYGGRQVVPINPSGQVYDVLAQNGKLYLVGEFLSINGVSAKYAARMNVDSMIPDEWPLSSYFSLPQPYVVAVPGSRVAMLGFRSLADSFVPEQIEEVVITRLQGAIDRIGDEIVSANACSTYYFCLSLVDSDDLEVHERIPVAAWYSASRYQRINRVVCLPGGGCAVTTGMEDGVLRFARNGRIVPDVHLRTTIRPTNRSSYYSAGIHDLIPWQGNWLVVGRFDEIEGQPRRSIAILDDIDGAFHESGFE